MPVSCAPQPAQDRVCNRQIVPMCRHYVRSPVPVRVSYSILTDPQVGVSCPLPRLCQPPAYHRDTTVCVLFAVEHRLQQQSNSRLNHMT
jgi:hypothetical protein